MKQKCSISSCWIELTRTRRFGLPLSFYPAICVRVALIVFCIINVAWPGDLPAVQRANLLRILFTFGAVGAAAGVLRDYGALRFLDSVRTRMPPPAEGDMPNPEVGDVPGAWRRWWEALNTFIDYRNGAVSVLSAFCIWQVVVIVTLRVKVLVLFVFLDGTLKKPASVISQIANAISEDIVKKLRRTAWECARNNEWSNFTKQYHLIGASPNSPSLRTLGDDATAMRAPELLSKFVLFISYTLTAMVIEKEESIAFTALFVVLALVYLQKMHHVLHKYAWHTQRIMSVDTGVHGIVLRERNSLSTESFTVTKKIEYQIALHQFKYLPIGMTIWGVLITKEIVYRTLISAYVSGLGALYKIATDVFDN